MKIKKNDLVETYGYGGSGVFCVFRELDHYLPGAVVRFPTEQKAYNACPAPKTRLTRLLFQKDDPYIVFGECHVTDYRETHGFKPLLVATIYSFMDIPLVRI